MKDYDVSLKFFSNEQDEAALPRRRVVRRRRRRLTLERSGRGRWRRSPGRSHASATTETRTLFRFAFWL